MTLLRGAAPLLVAHFYTRYMADLFGGSMLGWPTKRALGRGGLQNKHSTDVDSTPPPPLV
jgi:heme oxygenase